MFSVEQTSEFEKWFHKQKLKTQTLISDRVGRLMSSGHMGYSKALGMGLFEFK